MEDVDEVGSVVVAFRAPRALADAAERAAAREGISRSDIARRALMVALRSDDAQERAR
jgi:hypothetical protein